MSNWKHDWASEAHDGMASLWWRVSGRCSREEPPSAVRKAMQRTVRMRIRIPGHPMAGRGGNALFSCA